MPNTYKGHIMTTTQLRAPTDLPSDALGNVADALNAVLADSFALFLKTKNFHWHVSGPHFRDYHLMLDDQAAQILGTTDEIAERIRKTGNTTLRSIGDIARRQRIKDNDADFMSAKDMLAELRQDNLVLAQSLHEAKRIVDDAGHRPIDRTSLRPDTKQAQVLTMLRRHEGASGPQIAEAMGWAPHTVRGFRAGLAKKGIKVEVLERVRQVGPNKQGAKGSYSVYRLAVEVDC
jgi:starvation-inducible DNA-binding protein